VGYISFIMINLWNYFERYKTAKPGCDDGWKSPLCVGARRRQGRIRVRPRLTRAWRGVPLLCPSVRVLCPSYMVAAGWCWFFVRKKYCWLAGLYWANRLMILVTCNRSRPAPPHDVLVPSFVPLLCFVSTVLHPVLFGTVTSQNGDHGADMATGTSHRNFLSQPS